MHQNATNWFEYGDHSGGTMFVMVTMRDKKTGRTHMDGFHAGSHAIKYPYPDFVSFDVSNLMNGFIVEKCDVWHEAVSPYNDTTDYRKIK
jgi:hypothetical protein